MKLDDVREVLRRASPAPKPRSLAFDGARFWTNHRERDEIVAFEPPAAAV